MRRYKVDKDYKQLLADNKHLMCVLKQNNVDILNANETYMIDDIELLISYIIRHAEEVCDELNRKQKTPLVVDCINKSLKKNKMLAIKSIHYLTHIDTFRVNHLFIIEQIKYTLRYTTCKYMDLYAELVGYRSKYE